MCGGAGGPKGPIKSFKYFRAMQFGKNPFGGGSGGQGAGRIPRIKELLVKLDEEQLGKKQPADASSKQPPPSADSFYLSPSIRSHLEQSRNSLRSKVNDIKAEVANSALDHAQKRSELRSQIAAMKSQMKADVRDFKADMSKIAETGNDYDIDFVTMRRKPKVAAAEPARAEAEEPEIAQAKANAVKSHAHEIADGETSAALLSDQLDLEGHSKPENSPYTKSSTPMADLDATTSANSSCRPPESAPPAAKEATLSTDDHDFSKPVSSVTLHAKASTGDSGNAPKQDAVETAASDFTTTEPTEDSKFTLSGSYRDPNDLQKLLDSVSSDFVESPRPKRAEPKPDSHSPPIIPNEPIIEIHPNEIRQKYSRPHQPADPMDEIASTASIGQALKDARDNNKKLEDEEFRMKKAYEYSKQASSSEPHLLEEKSFFTSKGRAVDQQQMEYVIVTPSQTLIRTNTLPFSDTTQRKDLFSFLNEVADPESYVKTISKLEQQGWRAIGGGGSGQLIVFERPKVSKSWKKALRKFIVFSLLSSVGLVGALIVLSLVVTPSSTVVVKP